MVHIRKAIELLDGDNAHNRAVALDKFMKRNIEAELKADRKKRMAEFRKEHTTHVGVWDFVLIVFVGLFLAYLLSHVVAFVNSDLRLG